MKSIKERQDDIVADFEMMYDSFGKYSYLVELSGQLPRLDEDAKIEADLVEGCQSHVWLDIRIEDGIFFFKSDSDTLIIRGILYLLQEVLSAQPVEEVATAELDFLRRSDIMVTFDADRQKGIGFVINTLREEAMLASPD